jgi:ribosomal protein S18 acetylase RimI-like enzyme
MPVSENYPIRLARRVDARQIAILSRNLIEAGLGWSWTPARVVHSINSTNSDVILAYDKNTLRLAGFAIMEFHQQYAHLNLLAVRPEVQGCGIGKSLVVWLEQVAVVAGIGVVYLETPSHNRQARNFYRRLAYKEIQSVPGYYQGRRSAVRLARDLWLTTPRSENPGDKIKQTLNAQAGLNPHLFPALNLSEIFTTAHNRTS